MNEKASDSGVMKLKVSMFWAALLSHKAVRLVDLNLAVSKWVQDALFPCGKQRVDQFQLWSAGSAAVLRRVLKPHSGSAVKHSEWSEH